MRPVVDVFQEQYGWVWSLAWEETWRIKIKIFWHFKKKKNRWKEEILFKLQTKQDETKLKRLVYLNQLHYRNGVGRIDTNSPLPPNLHFKHAFMHRMSYNFFF